MVAVLLTVVLAQSEVQEAPAEPKVVVDVYPVGVLGPLVYSALDRSVLLYLPVSVTWATSPSTALYVEAAGAYIDPKWGGAPGGTFSMSAGVLFSFGRSPFEGFFICPKVGFQLTNARMVLATDQPPVKLDLGRAFLGGVDVGWQWTKGNLHVAVMIGASVGYAYENRGPFVDPFGIQRGETSAQREGFAFSLNGNLFRIGFAL